MFRKIGINSVCVCWFWLVGPKCVPKASGVLGAEQFQVGK